MKSEQQLKKENSTIAENLKEVQASRGVSHRVKGWWSSETPNTACSPLSSAR